MNSVPLDQRVRRPLKALWMLAAVLTAGLFVVGIGARFHELTIACSPAPCADPGLLGADEIRLLEARGVPLAAYAAYYLTLDLLAAGVMFGLAGVIFWRRSDERIGWLTSLVMLTGVTGVTFSVAALTRANPNWLIPSASLTCLSFILVGVMLYLFPNGRIFPRAAWMAVAGFSLWAVRVLILDPASFFDYSTLMPLILPTALYLGSGFIAQFVRYARVSTALERQQTKWVLLAFVMGFLSLPAPVVLASLEVETGVERILVDMAGNTAVHLLGLVGPLGLALGILRYRLWDIDLVIRRTLVYGTLTTTLALIYFTGVVMVQRLLPVQSEVTVVLTTLLVAALFSPLRGRIQDFIDRRFYRKKYDADLILMNFASTARAEVNLDQLSQQLLQQVGRAMQPRFISIWLSARGLHGSERPQ